MTETEKLLLRIGTARDAISRKTEQTSLDYMIEGILMNCSVMLKEQERKKGSWDYGTQCSVCKGTIVPPWKRDTRVNFCPWCGADMRDSYEQGGRRS